MHSLQPQLEPNDLSKSIPKASLELEMLNAASDGFKIVGVKRTLRFLQLVQISQACSYGN